MLIVAKLRVAVPRAKIVAPCRAVAGATPCRQMGDAGEPLAASLCSGAESQFALCPLLTFAPGHRGCSGAERQNTTVRHEGIITADRALTWQAAACTRVDATRVRAPRVNMALL